MAFMQKIRGAHSYVSTQREDIPYDRGKDLKKSRRISRRFDDVLPSDLQYVGGSWRVLWKLLDRTKTMKWIPDVEISAGRSNTFQAWHKLDQPVSDKAIWASSQFFSLGYWNNVSTKKKIFQKTGYRGCLWRSATQTFHYYLSHVTGR